MRTILYSHGWLEHKYFGCRVNWLKFYREIQKELDIDIIYLADNASSLEDLDKLEKSDDFIIHRFDTRITRPSFFDYNYHARAVFHMRDVILKYDPERIILCEHDFYLLNSKIINYIKSSTSGIEVFYCHKYGFPESGLFIINRDSYPAFLEYTKGDWKDMYLNLQFENVFPFTKINKDFVGDRYGEGDQPQTEAMDYYSQANTPSRKLIFNYKESK